VTARHGQDERMRSVGLVTVVVREYDEAVRFYVDALGFELREDSVLPGGKRWIVVGLPGGTAVLLARAATAAQRLRVGDQTGGRVAFFLDTDDFLAEYERLRAAGVRFVEPPRQEVYGTVAVFQDLYGNRWDLVERRHDP